MKYNEISKNIHLKLRFRSTIIITYHTYVKIEIKVQEANLEPKILII